eukprot:SAG31_NODE_3486_length_4210_cov_1.754074_3_plen_93_part_00
MQVPAAEVSIQLAIRTSRSNSNADMQHDMPTKKKSPSFAWVDHDESMDVGSTSGETVELNMSRESDVADIGSQPSMAPVLMLRKVTNLEEIL